MAQGRCAVSETLSGRERVAQAIHEGGWQKRGRQVTAPDLTPEQRVDALLALDVDHGNARRSDDRGRSYAACMCGWSDPTKRSPSGWHEHRREVVARMVADARAEGDRQGAARVANAVEAVLNPDGHPNARDYGRAAVWADGVREALAQATGEQPGRDADSGHHSGPSAPARPLLRVPGPPEGSHGHTEPQEDK